MTRLRARGEDGQTTLEWLGIVAVVVALLTALLLTAPNLGTDVADTFRCLLSRVVGDGGACGGEDARAPGEPGDPCVVRSQGGGVSVNGRIVVVDLESGDSYIREEKSDGTIEVTFIEEGSLGASVRGGGGVRGNVGNTGGGGQAQVSAGAAINGFIGETRVFDDPAEADQFIRDRIVDESINGLPLPLELPARGVRGVVDWITGHETPTGEQGAREGGASISAEAEVEGAVGPLIGNLGAAAEGGARVKLLPDGSAEITIAAERSVEGRLGLVVGVDGSAGGEQSVTVTVGPDGVPTSISVATTVEGEIGVGLDVGNVIDGGELPLNAGTGRSCTVTATLDLTDPALPQSAQDLVREIGAGLGGEGSLDDVVDAAGDLISATENASTVTVVVHDIDSTDAGIQADVNVGIGLGLGADVTIDSAELVSAHYWDPVSNRFVPWISCTG